MGETRASPIARFFSGDSRPFVVSLPAGEACLRRPLVVSQEGEHLEAARVLNDRLERVVDQLDELAARWQSLRLGEGLTLEWPRPERR